MGFFVICKDKSCKFSKKPEYTVYKAIFRHYYNKGREALIDLAIETGISTRPYAEPTYILADKLVHFSKVNIEDHK